MENEIKSRICEALENLQSKSFKKFKSFLGEIKLKPGYSKIPKGELEEIDASDLADLLVRYYTEQYALEVTIQVLNNVNEKQLALDLQRPDKQDDLPRVTIALGRAVSHGNKRRCQGQLQGLPGDSLTEHVQEALLPGSSHRG
ncbi:hypothetical protein GDO86_018837, partial [Hymenochirus boettgeri]